MLRVTTACRARKLLRVSNWQFNVVATLAVMSLLFVTSCATQQPQPAPAPVVAPPPPPAPAPPPRASAQPSRTVKASYQGEMEAGHKTANGERYDPDELTAASKIYPLGSLVEVTNPATGKSVTVRINDRGPHIRGRSLDLSERAAEELGITERGVARLKVRRIYKTAKSGSTNSQGDSASASTR
jgi:rare lipoprotein A